MLEKAFARNAQKKRDTAKHSSLCSEACFLNIFGTYFGIGFGTINGFFSKRLFAFVFKVGLSIDLYHFGVKFEYLLMLWGD